MPTQSVSNHQNSAEKNAQIFHGKIPIEILHEIGAWEVAPTLQQHLRPCRGFRWDVVSIDVGKMWENVGKCGKMVEHEDLCGFEMM